MTRRSRRKEPKHQKAKLYLIPGLLLVLAYVLFNSSSSADEAPPPVSTTTASARSTPLQTSLAANQASTVDRAQPAWQRASLEKLVEVNPFLVPVKSKQANAPTTDEPMALLEQIDSSIPAETVVDETPVDNAQRPSIDWQALQEKPVKYYFQSSKRRIMLVDDQLLTEGQTIDQVTITHLSPNRIELLPASGTSAGTR